MYNKIVTKKLLPIFATFCLFLSSCGSDQSDEDAKNQVVVEKEIVVATEIASENDTEPAVIESRSFSDFLDFSLQAETSSVDEKVGEGEDQHGNEVESINSNEQVEIDSLEVESELESVFKEVSENEDVEEGLEETVENLPLLTDGYPSHLDDRTKSKLVRLVPESITLRDCVMRGEIRNYSEDQYARDVTITVGALDSEKNAEYHWPLTMKPEESAPFEIPVDWFPHLYDYLYQDFVGDLPFKLFANTSLDVSTSLSSTPDIGRAFRINYDNTEPDLISFHMPHHTFVGYPHHYVVHDEKLFEQDAKKYLDWRNPKGHSAWTKPKFENIFSKALTKSKDITPAIQYFIPHDFTDIYYLPSVLYPQIYDKEQHDTISDIKIYQVFRENNIESGKFGYRIVDIWELIPYSVSEVLDSNGSLIQRKFIPITQFYNHHSSKNKSVYIQLLYPQSYDTILDFPKRNVEGKHLTNSVGVMNVELSAYDSAYQDIWIGSVSHSDIMSNLKSLPVLENFDKSSCYASGPLWQRNTFADGPYARLEESYLLGYYGIFTRSTERTFTADNKIFDPDGTCPYCYSDFSVNSFPEIDLGKEIYVVPQSLTVKDKKIRGLVYNSSISSIGRSLVVHALDKDAENLIGKWNWPLSIQPREYAPFQIEYSDFKGNLKDIVFEVLVDFSTTPDPTRSFRFYPYTSGTVFADNLLNDNQSDNQFDYLGIYSLSDLDDKVEFLSTTRKIKKSDFLSSYGALIPAQDLEKMNIFSFVDSYARLEPPASHPELAKKVGTQFIDELRAYTVCLDKDMRVVDVKKLLLFTPVYGNSASAPEYVEVNSIPSPNRWSPNAVRILQIVPYEDEEDMKKGCYAQTWIGGANATQE